MLQGHEITPESDWPSQYHMAMSQGCDVAKARPVEEVDCCLEVCHTAVVAAAARSSLEKDHRQNLENRCALPTWLSPSVRVSLVVYLGLTAEFLCMFVRVGVAASMPRQLQ